MRKPGKKFAAARQQVPERPFTLEDAIPLMQKVKFAKFDETVEIALAAALTEGPGVQGGAP